MEEEVDGHFKEEICTLTPGELFDAFLQTTDLQETLDVFRKLCQSVDVNPRNHKTLYASLKSKLTSWKCKSLWTKLDKRAEHKDYKNKPCVKNKVLIIGAGPCGLRSAIEAALLGAYVVVIEKRDRFSRNNVLHLWPFLIVDLKNLGAKKFFGQFCAGAIDHISIRRLQVILLKVSLLLGVQVYAKCGFLNLVEPTDAHGWRGNFDPPSHALNKFDFDVVVAADGRRAALKGFKGKEFRGKLAIGITVNFVNKNSKEEARVEEISGVAFIFNQQFFQDLKESTGIDLENIVYYKDETHYFVMCAKKNSLLQKGVLKRDFQDAYDLLQTSNVNHDKLLTYAREAANFSTSYQLPQLDFAKNHYLKEDVAMFDFTSLYHSEHAAKIYERKGKRLLALVVGDSLLEPFWPTGSGCARGFLGCFDAAWTMRGWGLGREPIDLLTERDSIFRLLAQTTPENISKNFEEYSINPVTRYPNLNKSCVSQNRVKHLFDNKNGPIDHMDGSEAEPMDTSKDPSAIEGGVNAKMLLKWCQEQTKKYRNVKINDMSTSWRNGLAFCAIIHRYRPDLIDYSSLSPKDQLKNTQLAFDVAEEHLGIPPQISASEMATKEVPDTLMIVSYVSQYHEVFKNETPAEKTTELLEFRAKSPLSKLSVLTRVSRRTHKEKRRNEEIFDTVSKRRKAAASKENEAPTPMDTATPVQSLQAPTVTTGKTSNRISALAAQVFGPTDGKKNNVPSSRDSSDQCFFCNRRLYLMERLSAEGHFFHRECFLCEECGCTLRLGTYSYINPSSDQDKGHFLCHLHYDQLLYKMQEEPADEQEVSAKGRPKLVKSKSAAPENLFKNVEFTIDPGAEEPVSYKTKGERGAQMNGYHEDKKTVTKEKDDRQRDRSYSSGKYRRLEARPLRRSSIGSVRKSDATVREKGKGYTFDDGLDQMGGGRRRGTQPLKIPSREEVRKFEAEAEFRPSTPSELIDATKGMTVVDIDMEEAPAEERKKKREEERKSVIDAVKTSAAGKSWVKRQDAQEGKVQKLGTLERRKAKSRRAMYPPLSVVLNPDDRETQEALEGIVQAANETERNPQKKMQLKVVDISLDDNTSIPSCDRKAASQTKAGSKTVSVATKNEPTPSPRSLTSPTSPENKKPPAGSLVAARKARLSNLIANDFRPPTVKDKWADREEWKKSSPVKNDAVKKFEKEEEFEPTDSPGANRRSLPKVPSEEPFHSTKETTKIVQRKPTGKPRFLLGKVKREIDEEKEEKPKKDAVDMGFVVLDLQDGIVTPDKEALNQEKDDSGLFSESSGEEMPDDSPKLQRTNARRFGKPGRRDTEMADDKVKRREQAKIRSAMKQRESKRLRMAQSIQRELEEVAVKQADLEREGVVVEKALRQGNNSGSEEQQLMLQWFKLVNRKNALIRFESELVIQANSIQLEDQQGRLEQEIRELLMKDDPRKDDNRAIQKKTKQLVDIVEQRNALVELLDEERKREQEEDRHFDAMIAAKGFITTV
ncbi:F-actin-methionine sulfoxide oxidase MICAL2-like isoform X4 [Stylophora pistillata]|uniref:F-actin-methionine sulfoxide oxidase MICAL2-like isoform X4 n=1 Tax=Stylophora pistillata TaxID=50429 RepID=UPI000C04981D|nr:F-actin-methionine sulfoxide oxidase MICAL2-like isoform X4 [Stylophora pistillata]